MARTALAAAAALLLASPASAAEARAGDERAEALRILHAYARCASSRDPAAAAALVRSVPGSDEEGRLAGAVTSFPDCLSGAGELAGRVHLFRGALAEALYERRRGTGAPPAPRPPTETYASLLARGASASESAGTQDEALTVARWVAHCAAHENPGATHAMLRTRPHSSAERAALNDLAGSLGACLHSGTQLQADAATMRALLAEALYLRTAAAD
jgi:hypothetical protein